MSSCSRMLRRGLPATSCFGPRTASRTASKDAGSTSTRRCGWPVRSCAEEPFSRSACISGMRKVMCVVVAVVALMPTANASASGPQTGALQGGPGVSSRDGKVRYVVLPDGANSVVEALQTNGGRVSSFYSLNGIWGIPTVTLRGQTDGLSRDGQFLV